MVLITQNPIPDKMPIIPEIVIGMPTSPPKSGNPKPKLANPTTINKMGIILLIIFVYSPDNHFGDITELYLLD